MGFLRHAVVTVLAAPVFLLAAGCAGGAAAAHLGRRSLTWDILAHFAPLWLGGAAAAFLAGLLFRGATRAAILTPALVSLAASAALIAPELGRDAGPRAPADAPDQLRIVQFNLWHSNAELDRVAEWTTAVAADIAVFQETRPEVRGAMEAQGWRLAVHRPDVMIFARRAAVRTGPGRSPDRTPGPLATATFGDERGEYTVVGVHYAWPTDGDQPDQERRLARVLAQIPSERAIVAGDLNSTPWSFSRRRWDEAFGLIRRTRAVFTWPVPGSESIALPALIPFLPIDHVYAGSGWATVKVERGPRLGSDHYPVIVTLAPVAPP
jgi:endonuclease/exonuclease/phosphatase (EEP) superfamily protein YafD